MEFKAIVLFVTMLTTCANCASPTVKLMHQYEEEMLNSRQIPSTYQDFMRKATRNSQQTVHVIFMNHLDVGYNGQIAPGFVNFILNQYFQVFYPRAYELGEELKNGSYSETFTYMTHPWLVSMFLDCPQNLVLSGIKLQCPSSKQIKTFEEAVAKRYITWHAAPMNMLTETMPQWLVERGLNLSKELDARFNITRKMRVMSQRDIPGITHAVIPTLLDTGVSALSVGVNALSAPPDVPSLFRWRYKTDEIIAAWHPGGYPDNPGKNPANPGGLSKKDCLTHDGLDDVLCFAFRTDDTGPPESVQEILSNYEILRSEYPGATIKASTFEDFFSKVEPIRDSLPIITNEIGDTWMQGGGTDPRKTAEYWTVARVLGDCLEQGDCSMTDKKIWNASRILLKLGEHTWGLNTANDTIHWSNKQFLPIQHRENFENCTKSWLEQREFTYVAVEALQDHPVVKSIDREFLKLKPVRPDLRNFYESIDLICDVFNMGLTIGDDGSLSELSDSLQSHGTWAYAEKGRTLGQLLYVTYDERDFNQTGAAYNYIPGVGPGYSKVNLTVNARPLSHVWPVSKTAGYRHKDVSRCEYWLNLKTVDEAPTSTYGAPLDFWVHYTINGHGVDIELQWFEKPTTRLPEAIFFSFSPYCGSEDCSWSFSKIGHPIDPLNVLRNGSQYQHGVDYGGILITDQSLNSLVIHSHDAQLACPITTEMTYPTVFPAPLAPIKGNITGVAFNLYNNIWDTNFIFWYPYIDEDKDFKARFTLVL